jgi:hypothetical protein
MTTHNVILVKPGQIIFEKPGYVGGITILYDKNAIVKIEKMLLDHPEDSNVKLNWGQNIFRVIIEKDNISSGVMNLRFLSEEIILNPSI